MWKCRCYQSCVQQFWSMRRTQLRFVRSQGKSSELMFKFISPGVHYKSQHANEFMKHLDFLAMSDEEQYKVAMSRGVQVATCILGLYKYVLFQIGSFYLEGKVDRNTG